MPRQLLPKERIRERRVDVYLSQTEIALIEAKAKEAGLRLAEFLRAAALGHRIHSLPVANAQLWAELAPTCSNLNQLARHANEGRVLNIPANLLIELHNQVQALRMDLLGGPSR